MHWLPLSNGDLKLRLAKNVEFAEMWNYHGTNLLPTWVYFLAIRYIKTFLETRWSVSVSGNNVVMWGIDMMSELHSC